MTSRWNARRDRTECICGAKFRYPSGEEMKHRHNFPMLCRKRRKKKVKTSA